MKTTIKKNIVYLAELSRKYNAKDVVISPGSRNAPISIAFSRTEGLTTYTIIDERCAAFFALGLSLASGLPTVVVCTSGTALLNLAPATAEAYYRQVPLIIVSADRPEEWIDQNDSQTMRQNGALANFVKRFYNLCGDSPNSNYFSRTICDAFISATSGRKAPVHINISLDNPLYEEEETTIDVREIKSLDPCSDTLLSNLAINQIDTALSSCKKIVLLCGFMSPNEKLRNTIRRMSKNSRLITFAESISNINGADIVCNVETFFKDEKAVETLGETDLLITIGGALVSKSAKNHFRNHKPKNHWHIGEEEWTIDTFKSLSQRVNINPCAFFSQTETLFKQNKNYKEIVAIARKIQKQKQEHIDKTEWSAEVAISTILQAQKDGTAIHFSNGLSVRLGLNVADNPSLSYYANRGVSGIDGATSTAVGFSVGADKETLLITGDISFLYDSNALWNNYLTPKLKIIVLNNGGGGIFKTMEGPSSIKEFDQCFFTPHNINISKLAELYNCDYMVASDKHTLKKALTQMTQAERAFILSLENI